MTRGLFAPNFSCSYTAGEISIHPRRKEICETLQMCDNSSIFTNAIVYDEHISALLSSGRARIVVSVDAGTRDTFMKVKSVDAFSLVCDTLRRYSRESNDAIDLKFIFLPGVNDNEVDISGFVALASEIRCSSIMISMDIFNAHLISNHMVSMAEHLWKKAKNVSISCEIVPSALADRMEIPYI
jgi:molybdenum cofactor biosynthesis enzyme MoaA